MKQTFIKQRMGVFETNSSSTHSICIARNVNVDLPKEIHFEFGEYGWEYDTLTSNYEKASYLYTGLYVNGRLGDLNNIVLILNNLGVDVTFEQPICDSTGRYFKNIGYIDHQGELNDFLDAICSDQNKLVNYLFSPLSYIVTGNDNSHDEDEIIIDVDYEVDLYYKGN